MLRGLFIIILCQFVGEAIIRLTAMPIPSAVMGMIVLFCGLLINGKNSKHTIPKDIDHAASGLLHYIGLLFVPAAAGISMYIGLIADQWLVIALASFTSTILTLIICALIFKKLAKPYPSMPASPHPAEDIIEEIESGAP